MDGEPNNRRKEMSRIDELKAELARLESEQEFPIMEEPPELEAEVVEETAASPKIVTMIHLGYFETGEPIFQVEGDSNLFILDGLIKYGKRELERVWAARYKRIDEANEQNNQAN